jgi:hypothetical protein
VIRLFAGLTLPLLVFFALLAALGNATGALAITDGIPLVWLLAYGIWRRKIEPIGLIALAVFALALVLSIAFGGSALPLELRRAVFPGTVGLACLVSLAVHRPLLVIAAERARRARGHETDGRTNLDSPGARRSLATLTAIIGVTGVADAAAQVILALTLSTTHFVVVARIASYVIIGGGVSVGFLYVRHVRSRFQRH